MREKNLYCWYLGNPEQPVLIGDVRLEVSMGCDLLLANEFFYHIVIT